MRLGCSHQLASYTMPAAATRVRPDSEARKLTHPLGATLLAQRQPWVDSLTLNLHLDAA